MPRGNIKATCPNCGELQDGYQQIDPGQKAPGAGDIAICLYCQNIGIYDEQGLINNPTQEEIDDIKSEPGLWNQLHQFRYVIKELT